MFISIFNFSIWLYHRAFSKALIFLMKNARLNRVLFITSAAFVDIFFTFLSVYIADLLVSGITVSILVVTLLSVLFFLMEGALDSEFLRKNKLMKFLISSASARKAHHIKLQRYLKNPVTYFLKKYVIFFTYLLKKDKHVCIIRIVKDM
ncbi:hypothetical protein AAAC51_16230 [Priestia megaterium]